MKFRALIAAAILAGLAVGQEEWASLRRRRAIIISGASTPPPVTGPLSEGTWTEIPDSAMTEIFNDAPPPEFPVPPGGWPAAIDLSMNDFEAIQDSWGGAVCHNNELYVWGGGHADGANNGVFVLNPNTGIWRRATIPVPIASVQTAAGTYPIYLDGSPSARHTYNTLASDGASIYAVGGGVWGGGGGGGVSPNSWKLTLSNGIGFPTTSPMWGWSNIPDSPSAASFGNLIHVNGKLYHFAPSSSRSSYDIVANAWSNLAAGGAPLHAQTMVVYAPDVQRFYALGDGGNLPGTDRWKQDLANFTTSTRVTLPDTPLANTGTQKGRGPHVGGTYYPPENRVIFWNSGPSLTTMRTDEDVWEIITPAGVGPGVGIGAGTYGRLNYCGNPARLFVVNGVNTNVWYVDIPDEPPPPEPPDLPDPLLGNPYYNDQVASPALSDAIVEAQCGPINTWSVVDITDDAGIAALNSSVTDNYTQRILVRLHWKSTPYVTVMDARDALCMKVEGVPGPGGERPILPRINKTRSFAGVVRAGGLIVDNVIASPGKSGTSFGEGVTQDNRQTFLIIRNTEISQTSIHSILISPAPHMYVEIGNSHFTLAGSHLAYIDNVAMAYVYDSVFESPGSNVALRCISRHCVIDNVDACSSQCDGSVMPPGSNPNNPSKNYISNESPLEVYTCGAHTVTNTRVRYRRLGVASGSAFAVVFRKREAIRGCEIGEPNLATKQWTLLQPTSAEYQSEARWATVTPLNSTFDNVTIECQVFPCTGIAPQNTYPFWNNPDSTAFETWRTANGPFTDWGVFSAAVTATGNQSWIWLLGQTLTAWRDELMNGNFGDSIPHKVPLPGWYNRSNLALTNITHINPHAIGLLDYPEQPADYCEGIPPVGGTTCNERIDGRSFDAAYVTVDGVPQP